MRASFTPRIAAIVALVALVGAAPVASARAHAASIEGPTAAPTQLAVAGRRRPPVDPHTRELRTARGILAGGIVLTAVCGAGFGLFTYAVVDDGARLSGSRGARVLSAGAALLSCTLLSIAGIAYGGGRVRALRRGGRVAWSPGRGLRF